MEVKNLRARETRRIKFHMKQYYGEYLYLNAYKISLMKGSKAGETPEHFYARN